jgi:ribose transport system substrate-binding protein
VRQRLAKQYQRGGSSRLGLITAFGMIASLGFGLTADGASADTMQSDWAKAQVTPFFNVPVFVPPGPPIDASKAKGKTVFTINASSTIPFLEAINQAMKTVAKRAGLNYQDYPNQGQTQQWSQGIQQAIATKADVLILLGAPNPDLLQPQLADAKRAGLKVLVSYLYADGDSSPPNVDALVTVPSHKHLRVVADYAIAMSSAPPDILILVDREFHPTPAIEAAMTEELTTRCGPDCKFRVQDFQVADWATKIPTVVQAAITADPKIDWIIPIYDGMAAGAVSGITLAGAQDRIRIATADASLFAFKYIQAKNVIVEDGGTSGDWTAWATIDQALRLMIEGAEPVKSEMLPIRMFDQRNIADTGTPPVLYQGWGDSYVSGYSKLWGIQ